MGQMIGNGLSNATDYLQHHHNIGWWILLAFAAAGTGYVWYLSLRDSYTNPKR